ncbi:restriction endonuclease subunit S [Acinetobacter baumannii]|uniref:restriction endonuclease subunit S n=1 Tax=Acinetobacter baumannii TaxID=470 RepID=UPI000B447A5A|nr:restriction endonuclease subunit S [Acinetobacter baumannii]AVI32592.1 type I restriction modification DNA specificity domain protein [Acinetobacter baumannii]AVI36968.1 type I restriction modification DNA specificity domain protein [Acinetobacter baumannii]EHU1450974.1 restriction endonuclease subunit S [Acinetobacter baumannii]EHU1570811.1 restriction endonuclease subunit S [Acinetobacter baumannii]EHU1627506.1 restriction endonuclease subunit S [Acinetobacter baumannii]
MASDCFETFQLESRCLIKSSKRIFAKEYVDEGIPFLRSKDVIDKSLGVFSNYDLFISRERYNELKKSYGSPVKGDLLISSVGNRSGLPYVVQDEGDFYFKDGNIIWISDFKNLDSNFLAHWFKSDIGQSRLASVMIGSAQKALTINSIRTLTVSFPNFKAQQEIAHILGSIDSKIEINRQMNETLEEIAQALFKSWFIDFDPVIDNALEAGNSIPDELFDRAERRKKIKQNENNHAIRSLFPDELEFTREMGWIPKGWGVTPVYEVADFINGSSFKSQYFSDEKEALPIVKIAEIKNGISEQTKFTTQKMAEKYAINDGDILFSWSGNPDTSIDTFIWTGGKGWLNQHIFNVVLHKDSDKTFVYYLLKYLKPIFTEIARDKQTTGLGHVTVKDMKRIYTIKPPVEVLEAFGLYSNSIFEKWYQNLFSSKELAKLRDTLLPKLISGEIRIPEAEALVEDV